ncbi:hypothetical protein HJFPF1_07202 [Paramyrothecium foliicola]|nr:hypothetical protein HJFPF1_07202 [Paramyrothecium foliicola]
MPLPARRWQIGTDRDKDLKDLSRVGSSLQFQQRLKVPYRISSAAVVSRQFEALKTYTKLLTREGFSRLYRTKTTRFGKLAGTFAQELL